MPLVLNCACGTKIEAKEDAAERRVNCPTCGSVIFFPAPAGGDGEEETYGLAASDAPEESDSVATSAGGMDSTESATPGDWLGAIVPPRSRKRPISRRPSISCRDGRVEHSIGSSRILALSRGHSAARRDDGRCGWRKSPSAAIPSMLRWPARFSPRRSHQGALRRKALKLLQETARPATGGAFVEDRSSRSDRRRSVHVRDLICVIRAAHGPLSRWAVQCLALIGPAAKPAGRAPLQGAQGTGIDDLRLAVIDARRDDQARCPSSVVPLFMQALKHRTPIIAATAPSRSAGSATGSARRWPRSTRRRR